MIEEENKMRRVPLLFIIAGMIMAGCTPTQQGAGIGATTGAIVGGVATNNVRGAAVGAAVGGVAGALIGDVAGRPGQCYYRDRYGRRFIAACPR
jgi:predicted small secreted protein